MERIYTIPLRKAFKKPVTKRANYAMSLIRAYLSRHMKIDEENIKIGSKLNDAVWARSMKHPPRKVKIKAVKENDILKAEMIGFDYKEFKAIKKEQDDDQKNKLLKRLGEKALKKQEEVDKIEGAEVIEKPVEADKKAPVKEDVTEAVKETKEPVVETEKKDGE